VDSAVAQATVGIRGRQVIQGLVALAGSADSRGQEVATQGSPVSQVTRDLAGIPALVGTQGTQDSVAPVVIQAFPARVDILGSVGTQGLQV
jgi:hypothetical protein